MESDYFDRWTREISFQLSRRELQGIVAGAIVTLWASSESAAKKKKKKKKKQSPPAVPPGPPDSSVTCTGGLTPCGGVCVDLQNDESHCSACGAACAGNAQCQVGECVHTCASPYFDCHGECRLFGACCNDKPGFTCAERHPGEPGRWVCCSQAGFGCYDLDSDRFNCNECGHACTGSDICCDGVCRPGPCPS